jgi:hypothetical protein
VSHEHDGSFVLGCGESDHTNGVSDWRTGHARHIFMDHPILFDLKDCPTGHQAELEDHDDGRQWVLYSIPEEEADE